jgi:hypothetical protein
MSPKFRLLDGIRYDEILKSYEIGLPAGAKSSSMPSPISFEEYYVPNFKKKVSLQPRK